MTDIPKEALQKAAVLANDHLGADVYSISEILETSLGKSFASFIADVSEKAQRVANWALFEEGVPSSEAALADLESLILPDPESDLLKEAREICARDAEERLDEFIAGEYRAGDRDQSAPMRCTLAALKHRKDG